MIVNFGMIFIFDISRKVNIIIVIRGLGCLERRHGMEGIMDDIFEKIDQVIKEKKVLKKVIAAELDFGPSGFSQAMSRRTLKVTHFLKIAEILEVHPAELLPDSENTNLEQMSLIDLIKTISKNELDKYLKQKI